MSRGDGGVVVKGRTGTLPPGRPKRALIEGALYGSLTATSIVGLGLTAKTAQDAERLGEDVGPQLLAGFVTGAVFGLLPGALMGLLLGLLCVLLLGVATLLFGRGWARWLAFDSVVLATAVLMSVFVGWEGVWAQIFLLLIWTTALCVLLRMRTLARKPDTIGIDEATAVRLRRAFDEAP